MSNNLDLKKGLNLPIKGVPAREVVKADMPDTVAVKPGSFKGFVPKLLVKEGDSVLAGSPVMCHKQNPGILVTSPVSGTVKAVVRGEKRKLLAVEITPSAEQEATDFGKGVPADAAAVKELLLKTGLWVAVVQRPYGVIANPEESPKAIFVSAFSTAPLSADTEFTLADRMDDIQAAVEAIGKIAPVHMGVKKGSAFAGIKGAQVYTVNGPHPAGNVGVQISHIAPVMKGETVWTLSLQALADFGSVINSGKLCFERKVAVGGPAVQKPAYVQTVAGAPVKGLIGKTEGEVRVISGDVLSGESVGEEGYLGLFDTQVSVLKEGREREWFGWAKPFRPKVHSSSWCYFSWLTPGKKYNMDTNLHGGPRAFVETKCFEDVTPMDIFPIYLIKACLAGDIEKMEKFGIYEVLPEDLALCDYVDPSKNEIQDIIRKGIDLMIKEMA